MDPELWQVLRAEADSDRVLEAIIRFARPGIEVPDVRIVSRFGPIATCRIRARDVIAVRARPDVISLKAARRLYHPAFESGPGPPDSASPALPNRRQTDVRRDPALTLTGAGVVVAAIDWGVDVDSAALRWPADPATAGGHRPGGTRFLAFWDQRDQAAGPRPDPYGYGSVHDRDEIDRALQDPRPYERLGYHPAIADPKGIGTHGLRICDIAAGNGQAGGPVGVAPDADLIFVHLADSNTGGLANFGEEPRLLEAVDFISRTAGSQPCVINISAGRICGSKDGKMLAERAFDELLAAQPGRMIVDSAGNYRCWRAHACGTIAPGEARSLTVIVEPADITLNEIEIWYDGADEFAVRIDPPGYTGGRPVRLGERSDLLIEGRVVGWVYHRKHDPNNGDNHIVAYLDPIGCAGNWTVTLEARRVSSGRFHAWIERDDSCPGCQARFSPDDSNTVTTIGSITTSHLPLIVGAYNGHDPARPTAFFSGRGPTRDDRLKPDLVAPGVDVLAARSAPIGASRNPGLLVCGNGTSFATPQVTGAVALCFQAAGHQLSAHAIRSLVLDSCDPAPDSDPYRLGRGYLNIPRLVADVQRALTPQTTAASTKETAMDTEDTIMLLAAAPATAYREFLYRPCSQLARWIGGQFDVVARPGQRIGQALREGDVLLEITLGRMGPGRCVTLTAADLELMARRPRLAHGRLVLRPRRGVEMSEPLPVEPTVETQDTDLDRLIDQGLPGGQDAGALAESIPKKDLAAGFSRPNMTVEISAAGSNGAGEIAEKVSSPEEESNSGSDTIIEAPLKDPNTTDVELFGPELLGRVTILDYAVPADTAGEAGSYVLAPTVTGQDAGLGGLIAESAGETAFQEADRTPVPVDADMAGEGADTAWRPWTDLILHRVPQPIVADLARRGISIPRLQDAYGDINLDYYSVKILKMPFLHGNQLTSAGLLAHVRRNFDSFVDTNNSSFPPLDNSIDKPRWESDNPLGAVINIHIHVLHRFIDQSLVVCSRAEPHLWVFTTAHGGPAGYHPVTGNRMWGIREDGNEWVLFTRGADRATQFIDYVGNVMGSIWTGADDLWRGFQARVKDFINANHGSAVVIQPESKRWAWKLIQSQFSSALGEEVSFQQEEQDGQGQQGLQQLPGVQDEGEAAGAATFSTERSANQRAHLELIRAIQKEEQASFTLLDAALTPTPAYAEFVRARNAMMQDARQAMDAAQQDLAGPNAATSAGAIQTKLEQAQLWLFFIPQYAHLGALIRSAQHDRLPTAVIQALAQEADAYNWASSLVARGRSSDLKYARDNAAHQIEHTRQLLQRLQAAISKGKEAVKTLESVEHVLDIPIEFAEGRVLPWYALVAILGADWGGFYASHKAQFDVIKTRAPTLVAELRWLEVNAPITRKHILHPIYRAIGHESMQGVSAGDVAFIIGRTIYLLAKKQSPVSWDMVTMAAAKATTLATAVHSAKYAVYGIDRLTERTRTSVLNAIGGEKDPHGVLEDVRKQVGTQISHDEALDLLIELSNVAVVGHVNSLTDAARVISPHIAAIIADVQGTGMATAATAAAGLAISYPLLPSAP